MHLKRTGLSLMMVTDIHATALNLKFSLDVLSDLANDYKLQDAYPSPGQSFKEPVFFALIHV